jgi:hypothetical protein
MYVFFSEQSANEYNKLEIESKASKMILIFLYDGHAGKDVRYQFLTGELIPSLAALARQKPDTSLQFSMAHWV